MKISNLNSIFNFSSLIKITTLSFTLNPLAAGNDTDISTLPNCSGDTCTINADVNDGIDIKKSYTTIINNATINPTTSTGYDAFDIQGGSSASTIITLINNGNINGYISLSDSNTKITTLTNNGNIQGIKQSSGGNSEIGLLNNYGNIYLVNQVQCSSSGSGNYATFCGSSGANSIKATLGNYHLHINQDSNTFNSFNGYSTWSNDTSHLVIYANGSSNHYITINKDSKFILSVGSSFNLNKDYSIDKLITKQDGNKYDLTYKDSGSVSDLFSHLSTQSPIYYLERNGTYFRIGVDTSSSVGNAIYKSNIQSINNLLQSVFIFTSNSISGWGGDIGKSTLSSNNADNSYLAVDFREYERFYYKNERENPRLKLSQTRQNSRARTQNNNTANNFFFTPFISHNILTQNNGFGLSGFNYGFVSGLNFGVDSNNTLGIHAAFSYGNLSGKKDTFETDISTITTLLGLHYKLDMVYGLYFKIFGDVFYLLNKAVLNNQEQSPNSLGFGANVYLGKTFDFDNAGNLNLELGINTTGLQNNEINFTNEIYMKNFIMLVYSDIYLFYNKIFASRFGVNAGIGTKYLFTKPQAKIILGGYDTFDIGADTILGYLRLGIDWYINNTISLNLDYIGSFGDKSISNTGMFNIKVMW